MKREFLYGEVPPKVQKPRYLWVVEEWYYDGGWLPTTCVFETRSKARFAVKTFNDRSLYGKGCRLRKYLPA